MVNSVQATCSVKRGDSPWVVAKRNLKANNKTCSNANIVNEMNRIAKLNGCNSVEDFNTKFFSDVGATIKLTEDNGPQKSLLSPENTNVSKSKEYLGLSPLPSRYEVPYSRALEPERMDTTSPKNWNPSVPNSFNPFANLAAISGSSEAAKRGAALIEKQYVAKINELQDDRTKILEYNKKYYKGEYYGIVDKKNCKLDVYNKDGKVVSTYTVGVGKTKGDNLGAYYWEHQENTSLAWKAELNRYTTAGEFTLDETNNVTKMYKNSKGESKLMFMRGDSRGERSGTIALHIVPQGKSYTASRTQAIGTPTVSDNRMSYGCVNLLEADYDSMHKFLGEGYKVYVLPEEKGNKLVLEKQKDGSYKFEQLYHRDAKRSVPKEVASTVVYDFHPERNPKNFGLTASNKSKKSKQV